MIRRFLVVSTIAFQVIFAFVSLFAVYMVFAVLDNDEADLINETVLLTIQPVFAVIISAITIFACLLLGLPLRMNARLNKWWRRNQIIPGIAGIIGAILLLLSLNPNFTETTNVIRDNEEIQKEIPNGTCLVAGWILIAFSILHFFPSDLLRQIGNKFSRSSNAG